jgi:hypothetical protein
MSDPLRKRFTARIDRLILIQEVWKDVIPKHEIPSMINKITSCMNNEYQKILSKREVENQEYIFPTFRVSHIINSNITQITPSSSPPPTRIVIRGSFSGWNSSHNCHEADDFTGTWIFKLTMELMASFEYPVQFKFFVDGDDQGVLSDLYKTVTDLNNNSNNIMESEEVYFYQN